MDNRFKKRLNKNDSALAVNLDARVNLPFESNHKIIPDNEINHIISEAEQFDVERQSTTQYRLLGTIKPLFHNTLCNLTTTNGLQTFRDVKFTNNPAYPLENLLYSASVKSNLIEMDGWQGYYQPASGLTGINQNAC